MAETVTCTGCGGVVPMTALAAAVTCPYCRRQLQLSPHDLEELARYRSHVQGQLAQAHEQQLYAEGWNRWYGAPDARKKHHPLIPLFIWLGLVIPLGIFGYAAQSLGFASLASQLMPIAMTVMMVVLIGGYMFWFYSGRGGTTQTTRLVAANVTCPACGAPHQLQPGEVLQRCRYCSAPLMPDERVMEHGRAEVDRALLLAEMERGRAERRGMTMLSSSSAANIVPYIVLGSFMPMTGFGAIGFTFSFLMGEDKDTTIAGLFAIWTLAFLNAGLLASVYLFRRHRREGLARVSQALVTRFGGATLADQWAMNAWMDRHWAGLVPYQQLFRGPYFSSSAFAIEGFPVLLVMNPVGAADQYKGFLTVRVSAWLPEHEKMHGHPAIVAAKQAVRGLDAQLQITKAGFTLLFPEKPARRIAKLESVQTLGNVMHALASSARQLGAQPVDLPA